MTQVNQYIRPKAVAIIQDKQGRLLVSRTYNPIREHNFYLPLGGGIEFGERGEEAIVRELREEIGAEVRNVRYLGMLENIFTMDGDMGHEIVLVYAAELTDMSLYEQEMIPGYEAAIEEEFENVWQPLSFFAGIDAPPLYPDGLLEMLMSRASQAS